MVGIVTNSEVLAYAQGRAVERDTPTGRLARGSIGEQILHLLPYLAVICVVGYLLGQLVKLAVTVLP